ncbi:MAG: thiamine pyrophosphate-binding protein [Deltaproteobacteria bacterium]|nr:thiamine pyrophosphate-binding protein [Deltaproteobacteria bacterium]
MADAYFRLTSTPLPVYVSTGPGPMNMMIAVANAFYDSSAFLCITGQVTTDQFDTGALQEEYRYYAGDFPSVMKPIVKHSWQVRKVEDLPRYLPKAFKLMRTGRPGPCHLDIPYDLYVKKADVEIPDPEQWSKPISWRTPASPEAVERALNLLIKTPRSLILAGGGVMVSEATRELRDLAEYLQIPVYTTLMGKGVMAEKDNLYLGVAGCWGDYPAAEAARNADLILAVGARFADLHCASWLPGYTYNIPPTKLIQVDIDASEIGRNYPVELGIVADAKAFLGQMLKMAKDKGLKRDGKAWAAEVYGYKTEWRNFVEPYHKNDEVPIDPRRVLLDMRRISPDDTIMVVDVGNNQAWVEQYWGTPRPKTHISPGGFAAMGFGVCGVLGAKLARPESPCVNVCSDGGFLMAPHAVATSVQYDMPAIWVILNNYAIGCIRDLQRFYLDGREIGTSFRKDKTGELWNPDFAKMAESMGARGVRIEKPADFAPAYEEALKSNVSTVFDVIINRDTPVPLTSTWQMPPIPAADPTFGKKKVR